MSQDLKPCPFCGNKDIEWQESHVGFSIECYKCDFHVGGDLTLNAVEKLWNTRVEPEQLTHKQILESCIDIKGQKVVSLSRLAEALGVDMLTKEQVSKLVDSRKAL